MKQLLLVGTAFLALAFSDPTVEAMPIDFTYTGSLVTFTVPTTGTYRILAFGAQGGDSISVTGPPDFPPPFFAAGGRGAEIGGDFDLTSGEILQIAVGGAGVSANPGAGGGGGGSFVVGPGNTPLVIAGGGGGGGFSVTDGSPGQGGLTGPNGGGAGGGSGGNGGRGGSCPPGGGGGGGFLSAGGDSCFGITGGGDAFPGLAGGLGVFAGGFGGGGGASLAGGGGGGGYSGGAGADCGNAGCGSSGGGGSFNAGTNQILVVDFRTGNGEIIITELAAVVPEPASIALLGVGLAGLATISWRRRTERRPSRRAATTVR